MTKILVLLLALAWLAPVHAQAPCDPPTDIAALREQVKDLEANEMVLQSRIREVGGSATTAAGIAGAQWRIDRNIQNLANLRSVVPVYQESIEFKQDLTRQLDAQSLWSLQDIAENRAQKVVEDKAKEVLLASGRRVAVRTLGVATILGDVVEHGGKWVVRNVDLHALRQDAIAEQKHLVDLLASILILEQQKSDDTVTIRQLRELQDEFNRNLADLSKARQELGRLTGRAHDDAITCRETDAAGDAAEEAKMHTSSVRLCDPSQRHVPVGIRPAQKAAGPADKAGKPKPVPAKEAAGGFVAAAACRDITGPWMLQQTILMFGKKAPGPQQHVEVVAVPSPAGDAGPRRYEVFGPDKARAPNGPLMRCTLEGRQLSCQRRAQQQACPAAKYVWAPLNLTVAEDVSAISGEMRQTWLMDPTRDPSGCTLVEGGQASVGFRFVPVVR